VGVESTVVDATVSPLIVYRTGAITLDQIRAVAGPAELYAEPGALAELPREALPSPGVGLRHYAPRARLLLREADAGGRWLAEAQQFRGQKTGIMLPDAFEFESQSLFEKGIEVYRWGHWPAEGEDPEELAQRLFAGLRHLDMLGCEVILCPIPTERGIGAAIRDRLRKAAVPDLA
jgi:L-threonylcarbamoyladenylate synthase